MMLNFIKIKVKSVVLIILNLIKRCFCCLRRRRYSDESLPVSVYSSDQKHGNNLTNAYEEDGNWESWEGPSSIVSDGSHWGNQSQTANMSTVEKHIHEYRINKKKILTEPPPAEEPEPNYFEDLAPTFQSKKHILVIPHPEEDQQVSNRISTSLTDPILSTGDLLDWTEDDRGWEEEADIETDLNEVLREQKQTERQLRKQEQLRRKAEKEAARAAQPKLATKLS